MHLGIIPDGNRRYARGNRMISKKQAYSKAVEVISDIVDQFKDSEVEEVSFYLLSEET